MPRRRMLAAAAAGALALAALTGCRSDPTVAAYVNGIKITEAQVDNMVDNARQAADRDNQAANGQQSMPESAPSRPQVVGVLVADQLTKRALADNNVPAQALNQAQINEAQLAQSERVPATSTYAATLARVLSRAGALSQAVGGGFHPTDADWRSVYDAAVSAGVLPPNSFSQSKPSLEQVQGLSENLGARNALIKEERPARITVNPRYRPLQFPIVRLTNTQTGSSFDAVQVPLGSASAPVVDTQPTATANPLQ